MSAKPSRRNARPTPGGAATTPTPAAPAGPAGEVTAAATWLDSPDPRRRQLGRWLLAGIWVYVAALWLLALDQTFRWGLFG